MKIPTHHRLTLITIALTALATLPTTGQTINEDLKLTASDAAAGDGFGNSIAIDSGIIAVGSPNDDDNGDASGSAYLLDASTGAQLFKLLPNDGAANDGFGNSIALDNGVVAIGAVNDDDNGLRAGAAYLFDASTGAQLFKLLPSDGQERECFGKSIAIDNGIVAVGATKCDSNGNGPGSAYLFDASTGEQLFKLLPSDGAAFDFFGNSIAIDNGIVAVGAVFDDDNGDNSGSAYLFDAFTGAQLFKLLPSDGTRGGWFGHSIAIEKGIVTVGATRSDDNGADSGSVYVFDSSTGTQLLKILPKDGAAGDEFGKSVSIDNGVVAVGAWWNDDNGNASGSAYVFDTTMGAQLFELLPKDGAGGDHFGSSIAIDGGIIAVGAWHDDDHGSNSGSAYLFTTHTPCPADLTDDGELNFFDVSAFITALAKNDPIADFNNDNQWNFFDVSAFLQAFAAGCP